MRRAAEAEVEAGRLRACDIAMHAASEPPSMAPPVPARSPPDAAALRRSLGIVTGMPAAALDGGGTRAQSPHAMLKGGALVDTPVPPTDNPAPTVENATRGVLVGLDPRRAEGLLSRSNIEALGEFMAGTKASDDPPTGSTKPIGEGSGLARLSSVLAPWPDSAEAAIPAVDPSLADYPAGRELLHAASQLKAMMPKRW